MTELILARHGQTNWNVVEVFRGRSDVDLDETGYKQAELLAVFLGDRKVEAVYSSPLQRALKTARTVASRYKIQVIITESLNDLNFGKWEGLTIPEVQQKYPTLFNKWTEKPHLVQIPDGEKLDDVTSRAKTFVNGIINKHKGTVVLVSHRVVHKVLILALLGLDNSHFWNIRLDTAGISIFVFQNDRWILTELNNTSYLQPLKQPKLRDF